MWQPCELLYTCYLLTYLLTAAPQAADLSAGDSTPVLKCSFIMDSLTAGVTIAGGDAAVRHSLTVCRLANVDELLLYRARRSLDTLRTNYKIELRYLVSPRRLTADVDLCGALSVFFFLHLHSAMDSLREGCDIFQMEIFFRWRFFCSCCAFDLDINAIYVLALMIDFIRSVNSHDF